MADTIGGQIISELGEIGKKVGSEVVKVPKDIAGNALESMGASAGKTQGAAQAGKKPDTAWEKIAVEKNIQVKRQLARRALEEISKGAAVRPKEPSIWERLQMEQDQKKENTAAQKQAASGVLQMPAGKRKRGDLFGVQAKKTATENRNVRQD